MNLLVRWTHRCVKNYVAGRELHEDLAFTSVFVTHDHEEAMEVADQVVVMSHGNIEQQETPQQVWQNPQTRFVLEFLGETNRLSATVDGQQLQLGPECWQLAKEAGVQGRVDLFLRPWEMGWSPQVRSAR